MREITFDEMHQVGGAGFVTTVETGSAIGATVFGGYAISIGGGMAAVTSAFAMGGAAGGLAGATLYGTYYMATFFGAGELGSAAGIAAAELMAE